MTANDKNEIERIKDRLLPVFKRKKTKKVKSCMSVEKNRKEAQRWFETAEGDLITADVLLTNHRYAHACFHSQQCGEKAFKALWYLLDADPWQKPPFQP